MKLNKFRAVLQERPWLVKSIGLITGTHPSTIARSGGSWEQHVEEWSVRNISEITVRPFSDLNLDEKAEFIRQRFGPPDEKVNSTNGHGLRRYETFTHTEFHVFNRSTYEAEYSAPYAHCWTVSSIYREVEVRTVRQSIRHMNRPGYLLGTNEKVETPYIFDAIVRITKIGVVGRCSSTIIDIFPFPANFDLVSV